MDGNDPDALVTAAIAAAEKKLSVAPLLDTPTFRDDTCDEHSMMTYVAIFCDAHKPDPPALDPAAQSLLDWVNSKVNPDKRAENFDADWHDGTVLAALANVIGASASHFALSFRVTESILSSRLDFVDSVYCFSLFL